MKTALIPKEANRMLRGKKMAPRADSTTLPMSAQNPQSSPAHAAETPPVEVTMTLHSQ